MDTTTRQPLREGEDEWRSQGGGSGVGHVVPLRTYLLVFAALMVLLVATVAAAKVNLGWFNWVIMVTIAVAKALLVVLFFMHVKYSSRMTWIFAGAGTLWLVILFALTFSDYASRGWDAEGSQTPMWLGDSEVERGGSSSMRE